VHWFRYALQGLRRAEHVANTCQQTSSKQATKIKSSLDKNYSYLGGNAFGKDKKGRPTNDSGVGSEQIAQHGNEDYTAFVYYEFEIA
jgi:V-type H+-transporting ATPase subunit C